MGKRTGAGRLHGYLVVDKPAGWTSHDVVARLRRLLGERRVGHAGTLDPAATGVLPIAVGQATKSLEFLAGASKTYLAEVTFGVTTDSYDGEGTVTGVGTTADLDKRDVERVMESFVRSLRQVPPMHSAVKIGGQRLYDLARRGEVIDRAPRAVEIYEIRLLEWAPPVATACVDCSKGTYIRSLAHDLGATLGVGAFLSNLVRLRTGPFSLADAWTMAELERFDLHQEWPSIAAHADAGALALDALVLGSDDALRFAHGRVLPTALAGDTEVRVYDPEGNWLGIAAPTADRLGWQPTKVIADAA